MKKQVNSLINSANHSKNMQKSPILHVFVCAPSCASDFVSRSVLNFIFSFVFVFIFSFVFSSTSFAQSDSKAIDNLLTDTESIRISDQAQFNLNLVKLNQMKSEFSTRQSCFFNYLQSYGKIYKGQSKEGVTLLEQIISDCEHKEIKIRAKILLANHYVNIKEYYKSIDNLNYVIDQVDTIEDKQLKHYAYRVSAIIYELLNLDDLSLKFTDIILNGEPSDADKCSANLNKYTIALKTNYQKELDEPINTAILQCQNAKQTLYANVLRLYWFQEKIKTANTQQVQTMLNELESVKHEIESTKYNYLTSSMTAVFAQLFWRLDQKEQAANYALKAVNSSHSLRTSSHKFDLLKTLIDYYKERGDFEKAYKYLMQKSEAEKNYFDDEHAKLMAYQMVTHNNLAKTQQIKLLNKKNKVLELENSLVEEHKLTQKLVILSLLLGLAFLAMWGYKHKRERQIYRRLSELDQMTLIYNRKGMRDYMQYLLPYSEKKNELISYAIFDLDHFKRVNDQFGHVTGDWVIKNVIQECQKVRNNDEKITFGRLGGEEFAIIMRDSNTQEVIDFSEQCRQKIEQINSSESGFDFQITASFGITTTEISGFIYTDLMSDADKALYKAKNNGRNQIFVFTEE